MIYLFYHVLIIWTNYMAIGIRLKIAIIRYDCTISTNFNIFIHWYSWQQSVNFNLTLAEKCDKIKSSGMIAIVTYENFAKPEILRFFRRTFFAKPEILRISSNCSLIEQFDFHLYSHFSGYQYTILLNFKVNSKM